MIKIIETNDNYEALIALFKVVNKELASGVEYEKEDLERFLEMCEEAEKANSDIHRRVIDFENKRFGGNKISIIEVRKRINERLSNMSKMDRLKRVDFDSMSKDELLDFIKGNTVLKDDNIILNLPESPKEIAQESASN